MAAVICSGVNPGAIYSMIVCAYMVTKKHTASTIPSKIRKVRDISPAIACVLLLRVIIVAVGINAAERAPSANTLRNEFGNLYAVKKTSERPLAPK